jgi:putative sugar O-methyltransferase
MDKLEVSSDVSKRLEAFIGSDLFSIHSDFAKSAYWRQHGELLQTNVDGDCVEVSGSSGFYVPRSDSALKRATNKISKAIQQPSKIVHWLKRSVESRLGVPRLMSYERAFDAVMSCADVSVPILSPYTIDHRKLAQKSSQVFTNTESIKRHFKGWSGYETSSNIICHYYYQNILHGFVDKNQVNTILEIGAGNGNFPAILYHDWATVRMILIDLPETLAVSIPYLSSIFPEAEIVMPNEIGVGGLPRDFDFAFLTVDQLELLTDNSIDLAVNCHSFQEMTHEQIDVYFKLIQRVCRESGFFLTSNRLEKIPCGADAFSVEQMDPPNRFAEYPWDLRNEVLVYEIHRLIRLVQLDGAAIRLECIHK